METTNLNLATKECLATISNFGHTVYQNICDGTQSVVPWGSLDVVFGTLIGLVLAVVLVGYSVMSYQIIRD